MLRSRKFIKRNCYSSLGAFSLCPHRHGFIVEGIVGSYTSNVLTRPSSLPIYLLPTPRVVVNIIDTMPARTGMIFNEEDRAMAQYAQQVLKSSLIDYIQHLQQFWNVCVRSQCDFHRHLELASKAYTNQWYVPQTVPFIRVEKQSRTHPHDAFGVRNSLEILISVLYQCSRLTREDFFLFKAKAMTHVELFNLGMYVYQHSVENRLK